MPTNRYLYLLCFFLLFSLKNNAQTHSCAPNVDFELGNYSNWYFYTGSCCPISTPTVSGPLASRHELTTGTGLDPYGNFPIVAPGGGAYSLKLGNNSTGAEAERARYYVQIPAGNTQYIVVYRYAVVFEDPSHDITEQPRFEVKAYDSATNQLLPCSEYSYVSTSGIPGFQDAVSGGGQNVKFKNWTSASIDLSGFSGRTIALDFASGDCAQGGHFGYGYVDMDCSLFSTYKVVCKGSNGTVTLEGAPGYEQYKWMDEAFTTVLGVGQNVTIPAPSVTTKYAVILTPYSGLGCEDTFFTKVAIFEPKGSADTTVCGLGGSVQLSIDLNGIEDAPYTYFWTPALGLSCTNCPDPWASPQVQTEYRVTITGKSGCAISDTVKVSIADEVNAMIKLGGDSACQFTPFNVMNIANNPLNAYHDWTTPGGGIKDGQGTNSINVIWNKPGLKKIYLHVFNSGCHVYDSAVIYVKPAPQALFSTSNHVCVGDTLDVHPFKEKDGTLYYWTVDEWNITETAYQEPLRLSWDKIGKKRVSLTVTGANGCTPPPYDTVINVHEFPVAGIRILDKYVCMNDTLHLNTIVGKDYSYEWRPIGTFVQNNLDSVQAIVNREQFVSVKTTNRWGCAVSDSAYISPKHCCEIMLPDAFTPNGDGKNDIFRVRSNGFQNIYRFVIMNRWGQKLFETTDQSQGWDGYFNNKPQDPGVYSYYIKYKCSDKDEFEKKGNFTLIR